MGIISNTFDWLGRKIDSLTLGRPQSSENTNLAMEIPAHPGRGLTPQRLAEIYREAEMGLLKSQAELFQDMEEKDGHIFAEMHKRKMAVKGLDWSLTPPRNPSAKERKATAALEETIKDAWAKDNPVFDALDAIGHGYSCLELEWRRDNGFWLATPHHRDPSWFCTPIKARNEIRLRDFSYEGAALEPFGWITHIHKSRSGYLARAGLHRTLAWPFLWKNYSVQDLAEFLETYGQPLRLGKYPPNSGNPEKAALMRAVMSLGHSAGGIIPQGMELDFKQAMGSGGADGFKLMIDWCEGTQSKAILGGTLTTSTAAHGNRSLGDVHNEVRLDIRNDDAIQLAGTLTRDYVYPIAILNSLFDPARCPRLVFDTMEADDLALYAEALPKLVGAGMDKIPQSYVHGKLKIPEAEDGEPVLRIGPAAPSPLPPGGGAGGKGNLAAGSSLPSPRGGGAGGEGATDPGPTDPYTEQLAALAAPTLKGWLDAISAEVGQAESLEGLRDKLLAMYGDLPSEDLTAVMSLGFACADLAGRFDVKKGE